MDKDISIILLAYNSKEAIRLQIQSLEMQTFDHSRFELIVVDDGGSDGTDQLVREARPSYALQYLWRPDQPWGNPAARNLGTRFARGSVLLLNDDDTYLFPDALERHWYYHTSMSTPVSVMGLIGVCPAGKESCVMQSASAMYDVFEQARTYANNRTPCRPLDTMAINMMPKNYSVRREHLVRLGGYDESFCNHYGYDDTDMNYRLWKTGVKPIFAYDCMALHIDLYPRCTLNRDDRVNHEKLVACMHATDRGKYVRNRGPSHFVINPGDAERHRHYLWEPTQ